MEIRMATLSYSKYKRKLAEAHEKDLISELSSINHQIQYNHQITEILERISSIEEELKNIENEK